MTWTFDCETDDRVSAFGDRLRATVGVQVGRGVTGVGSSEASELGSTMRTWPNRLSPAVAGVPSGRLRRASGLRREERAELTGISVDHVVRLEQGRATPSAQVVTALSRASQLPRPNGTTSPPTLRNFALSTFPVDDSGPDLSHWPVAMLDATPLGPLWCRTCTGPPAGSRTAGGSAD